MTPAQRASNRAAQRRLARNLRAGRPALPRRITGPVRAAQARAGVTDAESFERKIAAKPVIIEGFDMGSFGQLTAYSSVTVKYMYDRMTPAQRARALRIDASEYRRLGKAEKSFNVFWYHHQYEDWQTQ